MAEMKIEKYEIQLLDPLFYNSHPDSGAAGSSITSNFIGDIALSYSIVNALSLATPNFAYTSGEPNYKEILGFPIICTVGKPVYTNGELDTFTRVYDFATSFISEGYPQESALEKSGRTSFKQWIKRRGINPGNKFTTFVLNRKSVKLPDLFTIRVGNMKSTLCLLTKEPIDLGTDTAWINLYTCGILLSANLEEIVGSDSVYMESYYYRIMKNVRMEKLMKIFEDIG